MPPVPRGFAKEAELTQGQTIHGPQCQSWLVLGTEWDPMSGKSVYRIVGTTTDESGIFHDADDKPLGVLPFNGAVARVYPTTMRLFHEVHA